VPFDIRRAHPYSVYPELDFDIPTRSEGDSLARYLLRMEEVKQSLRIIDQCLHQMPDGPVMAKIPRLIRPRPGRA
jgi:NADH-quinone oxidoreductase subunit D